MKYLLLSVSIVLAFSGYSTAQDGKTLYNRNCNACHSIGGGTKVGPDLKGVTQKRNLDWLVKFVKSSKDLIASGDADAVAIFNEFGKKPMPSHSMSTAEIQAMLNYIATGGDAGGSATAAKGDSLPPMFTPSADIGRDLFTGVQKLTNKGTSCISCHNIKDSQVKHGGNFAKDLSVSYSKGIVETMLTSMPAMVSAYQNHELTIQEKSHLELFMKTVKENQIFNHSIVSGGSLLIFGFIAFIVLLLFINLFWKHTKKSGVKDEIYNRQAKSQ